MTLADGLGFQIRQILAAIQAFRDGDFSLRSRQSRRGDPSILIIEEDPHYARILLGLARDKGFKGVVTTKGSVGLALAMQIIPSAISLDIFLPDIPICWAGLSSII